MKLSENTIRNAEAQKLKAARIRRANERIAEAEQIKAVSLGRFERRAPDLATWREQSIAYHQQVFDAAIADVERQYAAGMAARFPGEVAEIHAEYDAEVAREQAEIAAATADYQSLLASFALERAAEPLAAIRMSRARWRVLHDAGLKRAATLELWSGSDYSVKLYKKLRRALRLEEGAALPPEVEAALQPTQAELDEAMVWATTPDDTGFRQIDDTKVNAQVGVPYIPDPATLPAVDPAVLAKMDELLGH